MAHLLETSLKEYFREAVDEALSELDVHISELTHFYLADLLTRFSEIRVMRETNPVFRNQTFAELYLKSQLMSPRERAYVLRLIGDTALFLTGLFADSFKRKLVDIDYYSKIGQSAYGALVTLIAYRMISWGIEEVFEELSKRFWDLRNVFAHIGESSGLHYSKDLLRLYERWLTNRSQRDEKKLHDAGIIPIDHNPYKFVH